MVRGFPPEIAVLLRRRDKAVADWRWRWPRANAFEDPRLEITSSCDIDVAARLAAIAARAAPPRAASPGMQRRIRLPSMAEGWGTAAHAPAFAEAGTGVPALWKFVTDFGDTAVIVPLALLMACSLATVKEPRLAAGWCLAILGCAAAVGLLKLASGWRTLSSGCC